MIVFTTPNLLAPTTWRRLWDRLGEFEAATDTTEGEIHEARISRLEAEITELRTHAGLPLIRPHVVVRVQS